MKKYVIVYYCMYQTLRIAGMVILIVQREVYDYTPYYPDPRIKYITCVDSEFNNACRIKKSFAGFISKGTVVFMSRNEDNMTLTTKFMKSISVYFSDWHRLDGNKYGNDF